MYRVFISWRSYGHMCIHEKTKAAAIEKAIALADAGHGQVSGIYGEMSHPDGVHIVKFPDAEDKANAQENFEAWDEVAEEMRDDS